MKLTAPTKPAFFISLVLFVLAILAEILVKTVPVLEKANPWLWIVAFVVLALGVLLKDY